jgi:cytochrome c biogenesis protein CcdA
MKQHLRKENIIAGSIAGLLGSLCCVTPLVLVLLGLSSVSGAMALAGTLATTYRWTVFIPLATLFLILSLYFSIKKKEGACNVNLIKKHRYFVLTTIGIALIVWVLLLYVIVPALFKVIA